MYRSVAELITNIVKHAKADFIEIEYYFNNSELIISVKDNGIGFDFQPEITMTKQGGYGLFSIKERLDSVQGSLSIYSEIQKGTKATIVFPVKNI